MAETFQDFIARDRERLHSEREAIFAQQQELETKLTAINNELKAIDAYEAAKAGKPTPTPRVGNGMQRCPHPAAAAQNGRVSWLF